MICVILWSAGCSKNGPGTPSDPTLFNDGFKGITQTRDDPTPTGWVDPDDWKSDSYWDYRYPSVNCGSVQPKATLQPRREITSEELPKKIALHAAFPNPVNGRAVNIIYDLPSKARVYLAIITDKYYVYAVLKCGEVEPGYHTAQWLLTDANGNTVPGDVYRCIFKVTDTNDQIIYVSHGDILVVN